MDSATMAWHDQEDARIAATIRASGWAITYVGGESCSRPGCGCPPGDGPPFAYTVGMFGMGHPELLVFGVDPGTASGLLNNLGARVKSGDHLVAGLELDFEEWPHKVIPEPVPNPGEIVFEANRFYCRPDEYSVPVLQLTYTYLAGRSPWAAVYSAPEKPPRPGTFRA
ncbi:MAG: DUF4262 domain-containing protein [Acidimicrobiia bacterium]